MKDFGPWALREHPCILRVDAYMHDQEGKPMTDADGQLAMWKTNNGDIKWNLTWESLENENRRILDNLNFSGGGRKRVWILYTRAGLATGNEMEEIDLEPDDLDGSKWWVKPVHQVRSAKGVFLDAREQSGLTKDTLRNLMSAGKIAESQYRFSAKGCSCNVCQACDGEMVNVDTRASFDGFRLMEPAEAGKFAVGPASRNGISELPAEIDDDLDEGPLKLCKACEAGEHNHKFKAKDCECPNETHPNF